MNTKRITLVLLAATLGSTGTLSAQTTGSAWSAGAVGMGAEAKAYDASATQAQLEKAYELAMAGRFTEARRIYANVAKRQQAAGILADEALWQVAALYNAQGNRRRAAATMDVLAQEAEAYGHPVLQARALIESAVLNQQVGNLRGAFERLERLQPLLNSPFISPDQRAAIERRIHIG